MSRPDDARRRIAEGCRAVRQHSDAARGRSSRRLTSGCALFKTSTWAWDKPGSARKTWHTPLAGGETVRGGPVEHLAGTRARTVLRVRRNVLGVLPILSNTRAYSVLSLPRQIRSMQPAHHLRTSARKKCLTSRRMKDPPPREWAGAPRTRITTSDSMGPSAQQSHQRLSGVACTADQELHHHHLLRDEARGIARGHER